MLATLISWLERLIALLAILAPLFALPGCTAFSSPETRIRYDSWGFELTNSKDVSVKVQGAKYDPTTHAFSVDSLEFADTASEVRLANVQQMMAYNEQLRTHGENIAKIANAVNQLAATVMPFASPMATPPSGPTNITTPWGSGSVGSTPNYEAWIAWQQAQAAERAKALEAARAAAEAAASQPATTRPAFPWGGQ